MPAIIAINGQTFNILTRAEGEREPMKILPVADGCGLTVQGELNDVPTTESPIQ